MAFALTLPAPEARADSPQSGKPAPSIGTGAHGHTCPGATLPFGMVQVSPWGGPCGNVRMAGGGLSCGKHAIEVAGRFRRRIAAAGGEGNADRPRRTAYS
ncbi:hypothetical protein SPHINGO361_100522 [Sphingomonas sp. EC-HK361]|nr:hypothetical protein SPHINGO361_100522 [Sphingomonas sp. EC-HK361]